MLLKSMWHIQVLLADAEKSLELHVAILVGHVPRLLLLPVQQNQQEWWDVRGPYKKEAQTTKNE